MSTLYCQVSVLLPCIVGTLTWRIDKPSAEQCCDSTVERAALATVQAPYKSYLDMSNCILNVDCASGAGLLRGSVASFLLAAVAAVVFSY